MATKKSKSSKKSEKDKSTKAKTAAKTVDKTELKANTSTTVDEKTTKTEVKTKKTCFSGFFARKYDEKESILTIFKNHKFYGALLGEIIGTLLLALVFFSISLMGIASISNYAFGLIAILIAIYAFSGACLNPIITVGMIASRRMSVIRGVMYIIAEIIGAWIGWLIFNAFHLAGGETAYDIPVITAIGEGQFLTFALIETIGAIIISFFFARALNYKRSVFTFAAVVTGGISVAILIGYVISAAFLGLNNNFIMNPAIAMMMQIFPTTGDNFGEVIGGIFQALSVFVLLPMVGGVVGFYLSDFTAKLSDES